VLAVVTQPARGVFRSIMIIVVPQVIIFYQHTVQELFNESAEERDPFVFVNAVLFGFVSVNERRTLFVRVLKGARRSVDRPAPEVLRFLLQPPHDSSSSWV